MPSSRECHQESCESNPSYESDQVEREIKLCQRSMCEYDSGVKATKVRHDTRLQAADV